jgi:hypothetical protein
MVKGKKLSGQHLGLICDESLIFYGLNLNSGHFISSTTIYLFCVENHVWLSCGMQVTGATW